PGSGDGHGPHWRHRDDERPQGVARRMRVAVERQEDHHSAEQQDDERDDNSRNLQTTHAGTSSIPHKLFVVVTLTTGSIRERRQLTPARECRESMLLVQSGRGARYCVSPRSAAALPPSASARSASPNPEARAYSSMRRCEMSG